MNNERKKSHVWDVQARDQGIFSTLASRCINLMLHLRFISKSFLFPKVKLYFIYDMYVYFRHFFNIKIIKLKQESHTYSKDRLYRTRL